jgi:ABC-type Fe3+/spermidine/putrescine transport system ATPase subunit
MTVEQNIAFGLRMRKLDKKQISERINQALSLIQLEGYGNRLPKELSGGQQQRVALARALAIEPAVLLLDEPLSNLDAKLRVEMRVEIKQIQKKTGITSIFVTHDQEEALTLSDRILIMNKGRVVESGTPFEVYSQPTNPFTGSFIGNSNVFYGKVTGAEESNFVIQTDRGVLIQGCRVSDLKPGNEVIVLVRHERIQVSTELGSVSTMVNNYSAQLSLFSFLGPNFEYICNLDGHEVHIRRPNEGKQLSLSLGQNIYIGWNPEDCIVIQR